jgi:hypothetical protein
MGIDPINSEPFLLIYNERGVMGLPGMSITPQNQLLLQTEGLYNLTSWDIEMVKPQEERPLEERCKPKVEQDLGFSALPERETLLSFRGGLLLWLP